MDIMEKLLASQDKKIINIYRGLQVEGEIVSLNNKEAVLDIGAKSEGTLQLRELPPDQSKNLKVGDKITAFVSLVENEHGQVVLSKSAQTKTRDFRRGGRGNYSASWDKFISALNQKSKLSGKVLEVNKGGLIVEVDSIRGFLPNSQVGFELLSKASKGMDDLIGQTLNFTVIEVDSASNKLIFTQRGQVSEEVKQALNKFKSSDKVKGKIVAILPFGLVVDISGVEGLVFISDVSWEKVEDLANLYKSGMEVEVLVTGADQELGRLNLSIKHLAVDPFTKLGEQFPTDEVIKGEITSVSEEGVFLKLKDGVEGFLPASKMGSTSFEVGKSTTFLVDGVDTRKRRINLAPFVTSTEGLIYK